MLILELTAQQFHGLLLHRDEFPIQQHAVKILPHRGDGVVHRIAQAEVAAVIGELREVQGRPNLAARIEHLGRLDGHIPRPGVGPGRRNDGCILALGGRISRPGVAPPQIATSQSPAFQKRPVLLVISGMHRDLRQRLPPHLDDLAAGHLDLLNRLEDIRVLFERDFHRPIEGQITGDRLPRARRLRCESTWEQSRERQSQCGGKEKAFHAVRQ